MFENAEMALTGNHSKQGELSMVKDNTPLIKIANSPNTADPFLVRKSNTLMHHYSEEKDSPLPMNRRMTLKAPAIGVIEEELE